MMATFEIGDPVQVRTEHTEVPQPGHIRTPWYLRGKRGVIERRFGAFPNPERLAFGSNGLPAVPLYWVRFTMDEVWAGEGTYGPRDSLLVEIYEHWLEPDSAAGNSGRRAA